ncbi:hypothetical protein PVAND_012838 [Polypedilum vanderplanki]|uniref:Aminopeptidase P N-terminal domain-containing protein n=1 Tax=Polypedilum vanderplanki TaxID=319348 RepID=A0A9J6CNM1_POLVA|nr:hypothetical protein PVAND_012838 [Polypedilum vanderplanki]
MNVSRAKDFINFLHKIQIRHKTTKFSIKDKSQFLKPQRLYGQPTYRTHPHLLKAGEIVQGITSDEISYRRIQLMETIKAYSAANYPNVKNHLVVIPSATKKYISASIPYVFRQNSDFVYFSGCLEPDSILALEVSEKSMKSIIFLRPKDKNQELWDGVRTGTEGGVELFAVDEANSILNFHAYVERFRTQSNSLIWYDEKNSDQKQLNQILRKTETATIENPLKFIHTLRWVKSDAEIELMRKTCEIGSKAVDMTMKKSYPGITEHQIFAEVDYQTRMNGANMLAYPPVVASGENASTTIHYITNTQLTKDGDMVLLDAGCEYGHYSSDITRTWPINGEFTEPQRILYEIVLNVQKDLLKALLNPVNTLDDLFDMMCLQLGVYLQEANLIPKDKSGQDLARAAFKFCPHHVSHYLGMDVHDTPMVSRSNRLVPGNVFTIEPGIYISPDRNDVPEEFRGLGLRIEDDVMVNNQMKIEILTNSVKEPDELLKLIKNKS